MEKRTTSYKKKFQEISVPAKLRLTEIIFEKKIVLRIFVLHTNQE